MKFMDGGHLTQSTVDSGPFQEPVGQLDRICRKKPKGLTTEGDSLRKPKRDAKQNCYKDI